MKPSNKNALTKALYLVKEMNYRAMPIRIIAKELNVTDRTAYRYLKAIRESGIPISQNLFGNYSVSLPKPKKRKAKRICQPTN